MFMKKNLKLMLALIISISVLTSNWLIANASENQTDTQDYGYYTSDIDLDNWTYLNAPYFMPTASAVYAWNHAPAPPVIQIIPDTNSLNKVYAGSLPVGYGGLYAYITLGGSTHHKTTKFSITINTYYGGQSSNFIQSLSCHEMGHAGGLADDNSQQWSIMNYNRDREYTITPFVTDCYGLQYIWDM